MSGPHFCPALEEVEDGVILKQIDDLCYVHFTGPVGVGKTRQIGERLIAFIEKSGCRKLIMSFEDVETVYNFLLHDAHTAGFLHSFRHPVRQADPVPVGSDLWMG